MTLSHDILAVANSAGMEIGFTATRIETGDTLTIHGDVPFPMASVFKIPILATAFHQREEGRFCLEDRRTLLPEHKTTGSGILPFLEAGLAPTWLDLLTLMIIISDNTATDMVIERVGGPQIVEDYMHSIGLKDIYFKMNCDTLLKSLIPAGAEDLPPEEIETLIREQGFSKDTVAFSRGAENNVSTANAMTSLVMKIFTAEIASRDSSDAMLDIMLQQNFNYRLPRFLPPGTKVAHKTGTIGGVRNNSGVIYIGEDNHVAITLFTTWDYDAVRRQPEAEYARVFEVETAMGKIGRMVYDHFNNSPGQPD